MRASCLALLASCWLLPIAPAASGAEPPPDSPPAFVLLPAAQVGVSGIYLREVLAASSAHMPVLPDLRLAAAPALGQTASFTRDQIAALVARFAPELAATNWSGAARVLVTRRLRPLHEGELRQGLTAALQREHVKDKGELELRLARPWPVAWVPDDPLTLKVLDLPTTGVSPNFILRFELWTGEERVGAWQLAVQARIWREVLVARAPLKRGQLVREADLILERRDVLSLREPLTETALSDGTLELVEHVASGQPLLARSVRVRPLVFRGTLVDGLLQSGALSISLKVEALEDGLLGQKVRVRNPKTRREFYGIVHHEQTVVVTL